MKLKKVQKDFMKFRKVEEEVRKCFARTGKNKLQSYSEYEISEERFEKEVERGIKTVKRRFLGTLGLKPVFKSLEEIVRVLLETGVVRDTEEAREFVPKLVELGKKHDTSLRYDTFFGSEYLVFREVKDSKGGNLYKVSYLFHY